MNYFLTFRCNSLYFSLCPLPPVPLLGTTGKSLSKFLSHISCLYILMRPVLSLPQVDQSLESLPLIHQIFQLFYHLCGPCWLVSVHVLHIPGSPGLTQLCAGVSPGLSGAGGALLTCWWYSFLMQPMMPFSEGTHFVSARALMLLSASLLSSWSGLELTMPRCRTWDSPLLSFMQLLPACSPASPGPSGWQHTHLVYQVLLPGFCYQPAC